jgi:LmbE family N-acetylglucosaminyl deacetylase
MNNKNFLGNRILVVTAHPDDESYMAAGSLLKNHQAGGSNYLICATLGERGSSHLKKSVSEEMLKQIRHKELIRVCKFLKIDNLLTLGLPDGKLKNYNSLLVKQIVQKAKLLKPDVVISYGPDGISGHLDHIAAGRAAKAAARTLGIRFVAFSLSPRLALDAKKLLLARRKQGKYKELELFHKPTLKIKVSAKAKFKALAMHKSQHDGKPFSEFPQKLKQEWLNAEYFV